MDSEEASSIHGRPSSSSSPPHGLLRYKKRVVTGFILLAFAFAAVLYSSRWIAADSSIYKSWKGPSSSTPTCPSMKRGGRRLPRSPFPCAVADYKNITNISCHSPSKKPRAGGVDSPSDSDSNANANPYCPEYFRWIHEDLRPWKGRGITRRMVERGGRTANFRLLVVDGRLYVESYSRAFQTRDTSGWWGLVQLLRKYPGRLPDLDLMFDCDDIPVVQRQRDDRRPHATLFFPSSTTRTPPPLFGYCKDANTLNIPFPDWSFWGWPDINIKPWVTLGEELKDANKRKRWMDREAYAFWKGNPSVSPERGELLKCNLSHEHDWNARLFVQDWIGEINQGFQHSNLADQCNYRYKIYIEGRSWSVSQKYILACDSLTLRVIPQYDDFFTRGLIPLEHYWPISKETMCNSIKFAVEWGNSNPAKARAIGRNASNFIMEELKMDNVYDYMFHLLNEYAKLLRYKPVVPPNATEVCLDSMLCMTEEGREKKFMMDSQINASKVSIPCSLPPAFSQDEIQLISRRREEAMKLVNSWEHGARH